MTMMRVPLHTQILVYCAKLYKCAYITFEISCAWHMYIQHTDNQTHHATQYIQHALSMPATFQYAN